MTTKQKGYFNSTAKKQLAIAIWQQFDNKSQSTTSIYQQKIMFFYTQTCYGSDGELIEPKMGYWSPMQVIRAEGETIATQAHLNC